MSIIPDLHLAGDPVEFARRRLGFQPDPQQADILRNPARQGILNCARQWGKSTTTAAKALHHAWFRANALVVVICPTLRQSGEWLRKVKQMLVRLGIKPRGDGVNSLSILLPNGSRIVGLPGRDDTIRGFSGVSLLIVDEAARVNDDTYLAARPMMAAARGAVWLMSTPNGRQGFFWRLWENGGAGWVRLRARAEDSGRIPLDFLDEERKQMGDRFFQQEYCCEFGEVDGQVFPDSLLDRAASRDVPSLLVR